MYDLNEKFSIDFAVAFILLRLNTYLPIDLNGFHV